LNAGIFKDLLEELKKFAGEGIADSDSDLVGKSLFFCYYHIRRRQKALGGKTNFQTLAELRKQEVPEMLMDFLNEYYIFKKKGIVNYKKEFPHTSETIANP
jgi:hypothetical protein